MTPLEKREILFQMNELVNDDDARAIRKDYKNDSLPLMTEAFHKRLTGNAILAAHVVKSHGGTEEEVRKMLLYLMVCMDAAKHHLDHKRFLKDWKIADIFNKYGRGLPMEKVG